MEAIERLDAIMDECLHALAKDPHVRQWQAKENNWVSYFAFRYLVSKCRPNTPLNNPAQIGIEVSVPQPPNLRKTRGVRRDIVIWRSPGMTCWGANWEVSNDPLNDPLAIIEWKVHRRGRPNRLVSREREWLRAYCAYKPSVVAYAVEVDGRETPPVMHCFRFLGGNEGRVFSREIG